MIVNTIAVILVLTFSEEEQGKYIDETEFKRIKNFYLLSLK